MILPVLLWRRRLIKDQALTYHTVSFVTVSVGPKYVVI